MFIHKEVLHVVFIYVVTDDGEPPVKTSSPYRHLEIWNTSSCSRWYWEELMLVMQSKVPQVPYETDVRLELTNPNRP